jgi:DNA invertase Pin-like site-specific DNA recombinase
LPARLSLLSLARHHLLELCGLVEARVIDLDVVYNPCRPNDRLLLGMNGSLSEFELDVLRARMLDAARSKASRGNYGYPFPSATSGTAKSGLISTQTDVCKK